MGGLKGARRDYLIYILLIVITLAVFWRVTDLEFNHFDDNVFVTDNQHVLSGMTGENIRWAFTATRGGTWMPLVWLSYLFDHQVGDIDPQVYHLTNLALHLVNVILLFVVLIRAYKIQMAQCIRRGVIRHSPASCRIRCLDSRAKGCPEHAVLDACNARLCPVSRASSSRVLHIRNAGVLRWVNVEANAGISSFCSSVYRLLAPAPDVD